MSQFAAISPDSTDLTGKSRAQRTLVLAGIAHSLHDGFTDMIYVLLPVWQVQFALGYVALALLRALYVGALAVLQVPSGHLARHMNARTVLCRGSAATRLPSRQGAPGAACEVSATYPSHAFQLGEFPKSVLKTITNSIEYQERAHG